MTRLKPIGYIIKDLPETGQYIAAVDDQLSLVTHEFVEDGPIPFDGKVIHCQDYAIQYIFPVFDDTFSLEPILLEPDPKNDVISLRTYIVGEWVVRAAYYEPRKVWVISGEPKRLPTPSSHY